MSLLNELQLQELHTVASQKPKRFSEAFVDKQLEAWRVTNYEAHSEDGTATHGEALMGAHKTFPVFHGVHLGKLYEERFKEGWTTSEMGDRLTRIYSDRAVVKVVLRKPDAMIQEDIKAKREMLEANHRQEVDAYNKTITDAVEAIKAHYAEEDKVAKKAQTQRDEFLQRYQLGE